MYMDCYFDTIKEILSSIQKNQREVVKEVSKLLADTVATGNSIFITGCSHSSIFAQEVFYRAGGFMLMNPIFLPGMNLNELPATRTTKFERISGVAEAVLSESSIKEGDVLIIASISGRNVVPVEMAMWAKEHSIKVIALTSMAYSSEVTSRHPSGKRLFELSDYVLDVMCPKGDAALEIEGLSVKTAPVSTVTGVALMHAVISETIHELIKRGIEPPVFLSANLDHGGQHNKMMMEKYKNQIHYI